MVRTRRLIEVLVDVNDTEQVREGFFDILEAVPLLVQSHHSVILLY